MCKYLEVAASDGMVSPLNIENLGVMQNLGVRS